MANYTMQTLETNGSLTEVVIGRRGVLSITFQIANVFIILIMQEEEM